MKANFNLILLIILLGVKGFSTSPCDSTSANFNYTVSGLTVQLDGMPSGPYDTSSWVIYDSNNSIIWDVNAEDTSFTFPSPGTYRIYFQLEYVYDTVNDWACYDTIGQNVIIGGGNQSSPCDSIVNSYFYKSTNGNQVTLTGVTSSQASTYYDMGGAGYFSSGNFNTANATFIYDNPGTYSISWTVSYWDSNTYCADTIYQTITVGDSLSVCDSINSGYTGVFQMLFGNTTLILEGQKPNQADGYWIINSTTGTLVSGSLTDDEIEIEFNGPVEYDIQWVVSYYDSNSQIYCVDTITLSTQTSSIDNNYENLSFNTYPNPFTDQFTIDISVENEVMIDLNLVNSVGQIVYAEELNSFDLQSKQINTQQLQPGMYVLVLKDNQTNQIIKTQRLIKK